MFFVGEMTQPPGPTYPRCTDAVFSLNWRPQTILIRDLVHSKRKLGGYTDQQNETTDDGGGLVGNGEYHSKSEERFRIRTQTTRRDGMRGQQAWVNEVLPLWVGSG